METMGRMELESISAGFQERMSRIALFDPLFELQRKKQVDADGQPIDMMELGMLTLLFFFEQKLMRNSKVGVKDLSQYLYRVMEGKRRLELSDCEELARSIIQVFRPASGKKREFVYFNWETRQYESVYTSILRANSFDSRTNTQYYTLDEDGLELVFATKEFYSEFQLSIHQLVLRKQLEKGEFHGALRQINEMRIDVESLQERMIRLEHEIKRSIVSEETLQRYSHLLDDIYTRLNRENEEFDELRQFVKETRMRLYSDLNQDKHQRAYEYMLRIAGELEKVHSEHSALLKQSMDLKNQALQSARESLYYTGLSTFNFEQDITGYVLGTPLPLESMRGVVSPFMRLEQMRGWSLLTVFAEQNISGAGEEETREEAFLEAIDDDPGSGFIGRRLEWYSELMEWLVQQMDERDGAELAELIEQLRSEGRDLWLTLRSFYDFWLILHQRSPLRAESGRSDEESTGLDDVFRLLGNRVLIVREVPGIIRANERYHIQNMKLTWGNKQDGIPE